MGFVTSHTPTAEAAVAQPVTDDPAMVLAAADRDGLLEYVGYRSGDLFELVVLGQEMILGAREVSPLVKRIRAVAELAALGVRLAFVRADGFFVTEFEGKRVYLPGARVLDWCAGFRAGAGGGTHPTFVGEDHSDEIRKLFESPSLADQQRMVILGLMYGREGHDPVTADKLAVMAPRLRGASAAQRLVLDTEAEKKKLLESLPDDALPAEYAAAEQAYADAMAAADEVRRALGTPVPRAKKTIVDALAFGNSLAGPLGEALIAAFGMRWSMTGGAEPADGSPLPQPLPEMPGLARLKAIVAAADAGWLRYVDEPKPNKARWLKQYRLVVGSKVHVVEANSVMAWLEGLASFHRAAEGEAVTAASA